MNANAVFFQGVTHSVCQDYADIHRNRAGTFAFLADGCSGSKKSDFGARFLVHGAMRIADQAEDWLASHPLFFCDKMFSHKAAFIADSFRSIFNMPDSTIDATLLGLFCDGKNIYASMYGDGCLILGFQNEEGEYSFVYYTTTYKQGYPNYPSYEVDTRRKCDFVNLSKGDVVVSRVDTGPPCPSGPPYDDDEDQFLLSNPAEKGDVTEPTTFVIPVGTPGLSFVAMTSDGIETFYKQKVEETSTTKVSVSTSGVIDDMLQIKNFNGEYLSRRLQRFFRDCQAKNMKHEDDLSVIMIGGLLCNSK